MAVLSRSVTVATTATQLNSQAADGVPAQGVSIFVPTGGATIYVGGPDVSTANGYPVAAGEHFALEGEGADDVYAVVAASTQAVKVLEVGV